MKTQSEPIILEPPAGWNSSPYCSYLDDFRTNQFASFANKDTVGNLLKIDRCFCRIDEGAINPKPFRPMEFMLRGHSIYRASMNLAMGGHIYETYPLIRASLECAAYALHIQNDETNYEIWIKRNESKSSTDKVRSAFKISKLKETIGKYNDKKLLSVFSELYERTIDFGGHPNQLGFHSGQFIERTDETTTFNTVFLHGNGIPLDLALKSIGQTGLWMLFAFQLIYPDRFKVCQVTEKLQELRAHF